MIVYHIDKENRKIYAAFSYYKPFTELTQVDHTINWTTGLTDILHKRFRLKYLDVNEDFIIAEFSFINAYYYAIKLGRRS